MTSISRGLIYRSAMLAVLMQWSLRLIGLVSVFILARLLTPADFGLVGLAMATIALVEIFSVIGLRQALLRIDAPGRDHLDTAWTIQLALFVVLAVVLALLTPLASNFYDQPALTPIMLVLSLRFVFLGLVNIGIVEFDRNMEFGRDMRMRVATRLLAFVGTIAAAVLLRSYWALVIGLVLQSALHAGMSYVAHPYRPRLSLSRRRELLGVSLWMFLSASAQVMHHQIERIVIGRFFSVHVLGLYSVSKDLGAMFTQEIATALNRVTFVTTARGGRPLSEAPERLGTMLGAYAMIAAPLGLGLAATADEAVRVLLGEQWRSAAAFLVILAPASALYAVYKVIASSLNAAGWQRTAAALSCGGMIAAAVVLPIAGAAGMNPSGIALLAAGVSLLLLAAGTLTIARIASTRAWRLAGHVARPFAAASAMLICIRLAGLDTGSPLADLAINAALGASIYAAALLLLWLVFSRPAGAEAQAAEALAAVRRKWVTKPLPRG